MSHTKPFHGGENGNSEKENNLRQTKQSPYHQNQTKTKRKQVLFEDTTYNLSIISPTFIISLYKLGSSINLPNPRIKPTASASPTGGQIVYHCAIWEAITYRRKILNFSFKMKNFIYKENSFMFNSLFPLLLDYYRIGNAYTNYSFVKLNMYPLVSKERNHTKQPNLSIFMIVQMKMK